MVFQESSSGRCRCEFSQCQPRTALGAVVRTAPNGGLTTTRPRCKPNQQLSTGKVWQKLHPWTGRYPVTWKISKSYPVMAPSKITFHITSLQSSMLRLLKGHFLKWRSFEHAGLQNGHQSVKAAILLEELLNRKWLPHGLIHLNSNQHWLTTLGYHTVLLLSGSHPFWLYRFSVAERQGRRQTNGIHEESGTCRLQLPSTWRRMTFEGCPMAPTVLNSSCTPVAKHGQWLCSMTTS